MMLFSGIVLLVLLVPGHCFDTEEVTATLQNTLECRNKPGMAVAVIKDGKLLYSKGFGVKDLASKQNVTDDTLFGVASLSKSFAATLLLQMLSQHTNLTLRSKVRDLLGDDFVMPDELRTRETTFQDMLSHKTAMLSNNKIRFDNNFSRDSVLSRLRLLPSHLQFRVDYIYNNLIYGVITRLAEIIAGKGQKWEDLVAANIFQPLGMNKSTFATRMDFTRSDLAHAHTDYAGPGKYEKVTPMMSKHWAEIGGSGAVVSTAIDMTKWMNFHLTLGKNQNGDNVLDSSLVSQLHTNSFLTKKYIYLSVNKPDFPFTVTDTGYALGLKTGLYRGYQVLSHTGSTFGTTASMIMLPTEQLGVITLINADDSLSKMRAAVQYYLLDQSLGLDPWLNRSTLCSYPKPWEKNEKVKTYRPDLSGEKLKAAQEQYEGTYSEEAYGSLQVAFNSSLDALVLTYGWASWKLQPWPKPGPENEQDERFYGTGSWPIFPPDMKPFHFLSNPKVKDNIVGIKITAFESLRPPIFCKKGPSFDVCTAIVAETYPKQTPMKETCAPGLGSSQMKRRTENNVCTALLLLSVALFHKLLTR